MSSEDRREYRLVDNAIEALAMAPEEDRQIRIDELEAVPVTSTEVAELRLICLETYRAFVKADQALAHARQGIRQVERSLEQLKEVGDQSTDGQALASLDQLRQEASSALARADQALGRAETLVLSCEAKRIEFRQLAIR